MKLHLFNYLFVKMFLKLINKFNIKILSGHKHSFAIESKIKGAEHGMHILLLRKLPLVKI